MARTTSRPDSLVAELIRRKLFEEFSQWCFSERPTLEDQQAWLADRQIDRSPPNIANVARSPEWRMARAGWERARLDASLPPDLDQILRRSLLDQRFNHALGELSHKELMEHTQAMQSDEMLALKRHQVTQKDEEIALSKKKFRRETCELFLEWRDDEKARQIADGSGSHEEKIEALGQHMFPDWGDE